MSKHVNDKVQHPGLNEYPHFISAFLCPFHMSAPTLKGWLEDVKNPHSPETQGMGVMIFKFFHLLYINTLSAPFTYLNTRELSIKQNHMQTSIDEYPGIVKEGTGTLTGLLCPGQHKPPVLAPFNDISGIVDSYPLVPNDSG
jgi:hypothetical protein